jgi:hypothetical protein
MRSEAWLSEQLQFLLSKYFSNIQISNPIEIKWGREAKYRFGSIRLLKPRGLRVLRGFRSIRRIKEDQPQKSIIIITSMFKDEAIPEEVVQYTITHELCHYAHGFSSSNKQLFRHPHHGGVVNRELKERGAEELTHAFKKWLKEYRNQILAQRKRH